MKRMCRLWLLPLLASSAFSATPAITLSTAADHVTFGQPVTFTATISPSDATGKVTFFDGVTVLGTEPLANGQAALTTRLLPTGARSIRATYGGNPAYTVATSAALVERVVALPGGSLLSMQTVPVTGALQTIAADLNEDGQTDLVLASGYGSGITLLFGRGDGTFDTAVIPDYALTVAVADFDGDGHTDLATVCPSGICVYRGNGDGTFQPPLDSPGVASDLVVADFNGDGIPDLATNAAGIQVFIGNGDGTFQPPALWFSDTSLRFSAVGDFHSTGRPDFVTCQETAPPLPYNRTNGCTYPVAIADFDGDGKPDLVAASFFPHSAGIYGWQVNVCLGRGDGTFQPCTFLALIGSDAPGLVTGDFNGDGKPDIVISGDLGTNIYYGRGDGTFTRGETYASNNVYGYAVSVLTGDFNGDGVPDLVISNSVGVNLFLGRRTRRGLR